MSRRYLLDTNVLAELARNPTGAAARRIAALGEMSVCTSIIVVCEVHYGLCKRSSPTLTATMHAILDAIDVLTNLPEDIESTMDESELTLNRRVKRSDPTIS